MEQLKQYTVIKIVWMCALFLCSSHNWSDNGDGCKVTNRQVAHAEQG